jgi:hypothetical protein
LPTESASGAGNKRKKQQKKKCNPTQPQGWPGSYMKQIKESAAKMKQKNKQLADRPTQGFYEYWKGREEGKMKRGNLTQRSRTAQTPTAEGGRKKTEVTTADKAPDYTTSGSIGEIYELRDENSRLRGEIQSLKWKHYNLMGKSKIMHTQSASMIESLNRRLKDVWRMHDATYLLDESDLPGLKEFNFFMQDDSLCTAFPNFSTGDPL